MFWSGSQENRPFVDNIYHRCWIKIGDSLFAEASCCLFVICPIYKMSKNVKTLACVHILGDFLQGGQ